MARLKPLPQVWLLSDARNDAVLEAALMRLPRGSGFVFRHYHLAPAARRARFERLKRIARARGHMVVLADSTQVARRWRADGSYGPRGDLVPVHSLREIARGRGRAQLLSPVWPTRSHPGDAVLGAVRFRLLAARATRPIIALGGIDARRARILKWPRWAGIDAFLR